MPVAALLYRTIIERLCPRAQVIRLIVQVDKEGRHQPGTRRESTGGMQDCLIQLSLTSDTLYHSSPPHCCRVAALIHSNTATAQRLSIGTAAKVLRSVVNVSKAYKNSGMNKSMKADEVSTEPTVIVMTCTVRIDFVHTRFSV